VLIPMTAEELALSHKRSQIIFILKRKSKYKSESALHELEEWILDLLDDEIEDKFKQYEDVINKETWVDCHPMYFHITEFEEALKNQVEYLQKAKQDENLKKSIRVAWVHEVDVAIKKLFERVKKSNINELTLEEKEKLFWITHPITY